MLTQTYLIFKHSCSLFVFNHSVYLNSTIMHILCEFLRVNLWVLFPVCYSGLSLLISPCLWACFVLHCFLFLPDLWIIAYFWPWFRLPTWILNKIKFVFTSTCLQLMIKKKSINLSPLYGRLGKHIGLEVWKTVKKKKRPKSPPIIYVDISTLRKNKHILPN